MHLHVVSNIAKQLYILSKTPFILFGCLFTRNALLHPLPLKQNLHNFWCTPHVTCSYRSPRCPPRPSVISISSGTCMAYCLAYSQLPIEPVCLVMLGLFNQMVSSLKTKIMTHDFFISFIALNSEFCTQQSWIFKSRRNLKKIVTVLDR